MAGTLAEEVRKRKVADALNGQDDDSEEEDTPTTEQSTEADTGAALTDEEAIDQGAIDQGEVPPAAAEKAPSLGYRFVPVTPPATTAAAPAAQIEPEYAGIAEPARKTWKRFERGKLVKPRAKTPSQLPQVERAELVKPPVEPAPDTLPQVERAELVKPPPEAPSTLPQVERGELVKVPPGTAPRAVEVPSPSAVKPALPGAPSTAFLGEEGVAVTPTMPAVKRAETAVPPVPTAEYTDRVQKWRAAMQAYGFDAKVKPDGTWVGVDAQGKEVTPEQNKGLYQFGAWISKQYGFSGQEQKLGQLGDAAPIPPAGKGAQSRLPDVGSGVVTPTRLPDVGSGVVTPTKLPDVGVVNPNGSDLPQRVQAVGNNAPAAFIVHHTSGRGTVDGVVSTLKERGLGVQYVMDRDGNIFATGGPGAQNILKGWGKGEGLSNQNIVGMEIIAKDDKDVTPAQAQSFARFIAARYPNTPLYGHGEVNPGHKEADEGQTAKAAALAYRDKLGQGQVAETPGAPQAQPVTKQ